MERSYHGYIDKLHKETMNRIHHLDLRLCDEIHSNQQMVFLHDKQYLLHHWFLFSNRNCKDKF